MKDQYSLIQMMRWYGPQDPVSLDDIAQAGSSGVVSALHDVPIGDIWEIEAINNYKEKINSAQLSWTVVESLPVHEAIKTGSGRFRQLIEQYKTSVTNLGKCGIKVITYNFMPVLDWLRTDVSFFLENKVEALKFCWKEYAVFDLFILKRKGAFQDYSPNERKSLSLFFEQLSEKDKERISKCMLLGLPGSDESFNLEEIQHLLDNYNLITEDILRSNLIAFLKEIMPVAKAAGVKMAIHPDDPPFPVFGLPRIMSTSDDIRHIMNAVPGEANGLCFCTGSYGARPDNDIVQMIRNFGSRIQFFHLRNTKRIPGTKDFYEANHLEGDTDIYEVMKEIIHLMIQEKRSIPMRPDHGHKMLDDLKKITYPGYSAIGRLKGLAELRGLEMGIRKSL